MLQCTVKRGNEQKIEMVRYAFAIESLRFVDNKEREPRRLRYGRDEEDRKSFRASSNAEEGANRLLSHSLLSWRLSSCAFHLSFDSHVAMR